MTSTSIQFYLEDYLEGLDSLPTELQRNFILMRDLDTRAQAIIKNIDEESKTLMAEILDNKNIANRKKKVSQINEMFSKAREYGDDKVSMLFTLFLQILMCQQKIVDLLGLNFLGPTTTFPPKMNLRRL